MRRALVVACVAWVTAFVVQLAWLTLFSGGDSVAWSDLWTAPLVALMYGLPMLVVGVLLVVPIVLLTSRGKPRDESRRGTVVAAVLLIVVVALFPVPMQLDPVPCEKATIVTPLASVPSWWTMDSGASEFWVYMLKVEHTSCLD